MIDKVALEKFRDLFITKDDLYRSISKKIRMSPIENPVEVCNIHLIQLLKKYQNGVIDEDRILDWVNIVWFSGFYEYCDENSDSIASVMNELEELDEGEAIISNERIEKYIHALECNIEI